MERTELRLLVIALACGLAGSATGAEAAADAVPLSFAPTDDAYVRSNFPTETTGAQTTIRVYKSGTTETHSYLKFTVTGLSGPAATAKLRLFVNRASSVGGSIYRVPNTGWDEGTITWQTKPPATGTALAHLGSVAANTWVELDVTSAITGDGLHAFVLKDGGAAAWYLSSEGAQPPQLLVTPGGPPGPPPPPPPPPPPGGAPLTFGALEDAYVRSNFPTETTGTQTTIRVYKSGSTETHSYLKFTVTGLSGPAATAKLRLFVNRASSVGGSIYRVPNTGWDEGTITWQTKPDPAAGTLASAGAVTAGTWVEFDVTAAVTGNATYAFALKDGAAAAWYDSSEGAQPPQLVVTPSGPPVRPVADFSASTTTGTAPLTVTFTDASTGPPTEWAWYLDGDTVPDSAERNPAFTYTVPGTYTVALTATNAEGSDTASRDAYIRVDPPTRPENVARPTIAGVARQWQTLTAANGDWNGSPPPTFAYRWLRCDPSDACTEIVDATTDRHLLTDADVGSTIKVVVTATNPAGSSSATSDATEQVAEGAPDPVIAAAGDIACNPNGGNFNGGAGTATLCHQAATYGLLVDAGLTAVLVLGDSQYEKGEYANFLASYDPSWGGVKAITYPAPGNHEYDTPGATGYYRYFGAAAGDPAKGYYSFDVGTWHLIALNSECSPVGGCGAGSPQEQWLRADLATHPAACTLAYWHHPRFSSVHGIDARTSAFWQTLYEYGAEIILNGHDHNYERFAAQTPTGTADRDRGVREFVVGTGGKNLRQFSATIAANSEARNAVYGVLKLTLRADGYDWQFVPEPGKTFTDSGSASCH